jgi:mono/diheme cytochrome c family protein
MGTARQLKTGILAGFVWLGTVGVGIGEGQTAAPASESVLALEGRGIYRSACAPCHGQRGDGQGPAARSINPKPRDFTAGVFKFRSTPSGALPTDSDLFRTISDGVPSTWMPAWEQLLSAQQRWAVVEYLKTLVPDFQSEFAEDPPLPLPSGPPASASAEEGRFVYLALKCWECHGMRGRGDGPSAGTLEDDWERSIEPYDFTHGDYKGGGNSEDVYRTLRTGLSGTPMPAYEPGVVLYPGGRGLDLSQYAEGLGGEEMTALENYLARQPERSAVAAMSEEGQGELVERRLWSLVAYLQSLSRSRSLFYRLFVEDVNATPPGRVQ